MIQRRNAFVNCKALDEALPVWRYTDMVAMGDPIYESCVHVAWTRFTFWVGLTTLRSHYQYTENEMSHNMWAHHVDLFLIYSLSLSFRYFIV